MACCDGRERLIAEEFSQLKVSYPLLHEADEGEEILNSFLPKNKLARNLTCGKSSGGGEILLDLFSSPAPKSLTQLSSASNPLPAFKPPAVVPFQWEEIPGKPKPYNSPSRDDKHALKLPPRLTVYSNSKPATQHGTSWKKMLVRYRGNLSAEPNLQEKDKTKKMHRPSTEKRTSRSYTNFPVSSSCSGNNRMSMNNILSRAGYKSATNLSLPSFFKSFRSKSSNPTYCKPLLKSTNTISRTPNVLVAPKSEKPLLIPKNEKSFKKSFIGRSQRGPKLRDLKGLANVETWGPSFTTYLQWVDPTDAPSYKNPHSEGHNQGHICNLLEGLPSSKASKVQTGHHWANKYSMNKDRITQVEPLCHVNDLKNGRRRHLNLRIAASVYEILTCKCRRALQKVSRSQCKILGKSSC